MAKFAAIQRVTAVPRLPVRPRDGHKGLFGRVLIVGGSDQMIGAPVLAGTAALRMGCGLVQIAMPSSVLAHAISITPELIGLGLGTAARERELFESADKANALVIGPGLGQSPAAARRLHGLIRLDKPMVLDADALNILAAAKRWPARFEGRAVLTPHPGEMARLSTLLDQSKMPPNAASPDDNDRIALAVLAANTFKQVIVLKGHRTVVTDGQRVYLNNTGDSTLSKAGTGDVLSGILGCLLGQHMERFEAATLAVHLHGRAGEKAGQIFGRRFALARDVIECLSHFIDRKMTVTGKG